MNLAEDVDVELVAHILGNRKIAGIQLIRHATGMSLKDAIALYTDLREQQPDKFVAAHDEYWTGFYS